jgi:hypothetical protein
MIIKDITEKLRIFTGILAAGLTRDNPSGIMRLTDKHLGMLLGEAAHLDDK